jgi:hypothetical protein
MNYQLVDYQGNSISIPDNKAKKIAEVAGLIEIEVNGTVHYINPSNIASIKPENRAKYKTSTELNMPDLAIDASVN